MEHGRVSESIRVILLLLLYFSLFLLIFSSILSADELDEKSKILLLPTDSELMLVPAGNQDNSADFDMDAHPLSLSLPVLSASHALSQLKAVTDWEDVAGGIPIDQPSSVLAEGNAQSASLPQRQEELDETLKETDYQLLRLEDEPDLSTQEEGQIERQPVNLRERQSTSQLVNSGNFQEHRLSRAETASFNGSEDKLFLHELSEQSQHQEQSSIIGNHEQERSSIIVNHEQEQSSILGNHGIGTGIPSAWNPSLSMSQMRLQDDMVYHRNSVSSSRSLLLTDLSPRPPRFQPPAPLPVPQVNRTPPRQPSQSFSFHTPSQSRHSLTFTPSQSQYDPSRTQTPFIATNMVDHRQLSILQRKLLDMTQQITQQEQQLGQQRRQLQILEDEKNFFQSEYEKATTAVDRNRREALSARVRLEHNDLSVN
jgi:hypothetical protein